MQIWEAFSAKDLKDCLLLLKAHTVAEQEAEDCINAKRIARLLSEDWGFWYTATTNLNKILKFVTELDKLGAEAALDPQKISQKDREATAQKIVRILEAVDKETKSFGWKMRARMGTKKRWYNPWRGPKQSGGFGIWEALEQR